MDKRVNNRITRTSGMNTWRAGCGGSCTSGSEGGPQKPTRRKPDRALRPDPYTKLRSPTRGKYFELYVIIDIYSRFVVGWTVAERESGRLAKAFIARAYRSQNVKPGMGVDEFVDRQERSPAEPAQVFAGLRFAGEPTVNRRRLRQSHAGLRDLVRLCSSR